MTRKNFVPILAVLGIAVALAAAFGLRAIQFPAGFLGAVAQEDVPPAPPEAAAGSSGVVRLSADQIRQFGVETAAAGPGRIRMEIVLPGEVALNADRVAHVVPRVSGVVREVRKNLGDPVRAGEVMAVLESRELADVTAALLAARERVNLAQSNFSREEQLWNKKITSELDYIQAKNALAETGIELRTAEQKLRALGFSDDYIEGLPRRPEKAAVLYEMTAPYDATIIEKHISLGEVLRDDTPAFVIADLSSVWANLDVHQKDLPLIEIGQHASIGAGNSTDTTAGRISFLEPIAEETNRTIHARVVIPNAGGRWRPGLFVTGRVAVGDVPVPVAVPNEALLLIGGKTCVFLRDGEAFRVQPVVTGRANGIITEVTAGLAPGQIFVARGAFTLKSELGKPDVED